MDFSFHLLTNVLEAPSDFMIFIGRFHPIIVHLPIGFVTLAAVAQIAVRYPKFQTLNPFLKYFWGIAAISAAFTVLTGYLLSLSGDYDQNTLFWHKWSGVIILALTISSYFISKRELDRLNFSKLVLTIFVAITMIYTGHLGGNLTHGQTYLFEYAPNPVRSLAGLPPKTAPRPKVTVLDSADIYLDLISPIMNSKCTSCHNPQKEKGRLLLTSYQNIMNGGENGEVIIPGDINASELFKRINLPEEHDDFMPPEGKRPLTEQEIAIVEWWISSGAPTDGFVTKIDNNKNIIAIVNNYLGLDKNDVFNKTVIQADKSILDSLQHQGFIINHLMKSNNFLEANYSLSEKQLTMNKLESLQKIREQLVWLDLSNSGVKDTHLQKIKTLENLVKLDLSGNEISDAGLESLSPLTNLETLNLYNTNISEGLFNLLPKLTNLQRIYVWQTNFTDSLTLKIQEKYPTLEIVSKRSTND